MTTVAEELEAKTFQYWCLVTFPISVEESLGISNDLLSRLNPTRPLAALTEAYQAKIIRGGRRKRLPPRNNVVPLARNNRS